MGWGENDRGVSFTFGAEVVSKFLHKHDFDLICRAHQVSYFRNLFILASATLILAGRAVDPHSFLADPDLVAFYADPDSALKFL